MLRKLFATTILALGIFGILFLAGNRQARSANDDNRSLADRVEDFGRTIFGVPRPGASGDTPDRTPAGSRGDAPPSLPKTRSNQSSSPSPTYPQRSDNSASPMGLPRAGGSSAGVVVPRTDRGGLAPGYSPSGVGSPGFGRSAGSGVSSDDEGSVGFSVAGSEDSAPSRGPTETKIAASSVAGNPATAPLYERMNAFRQSVFSDSGSSKSDSAARSGSDSPTPVRTGLPPASVSPDKPSAAVSPERPTAAVSPERPSLQSPYVISPGPAVTPQRSVPSVWRADQPSDSSTPAVRSAPTASPAAKPSKVADAPAKPSRGVLLTRQSPNLSVETVGPRRIAVGKESVYEVTIHNTGEVSAEELVVLVDFPPWAEVMGAEASAGATHLAASGENVRQFQWKVGRLEAKGRERLVLRIVPRESKPFDLALRWDYKQVASQAVIEVQEPKLEIHLEGPREVAYGRKEVYKLRIANSGNGDAENVAIKLFPAGSGQDAAATHSFGTLAAGEQKSIDVELTARQAGTLTMKVEAQCDGGGRAELTEPVLVRRAALLISAEGPKLQFVDTAATYRIRVSNPGTAPARQVNLSATLPPGAKYISSTEGGQPDGGAGAVRWRLDSLNPGVEKTFETKCSLGQAGANRLEIVAKAEDDLAATAEATTRVEAMANLVMDVIDPVGPVPVGEEATYELRIRNRGTKSAEQIEVMAFFSQGIEPTSVEGAPHKIGVGQVTFSPISSLPAAKELRLKIHARAQTAGSHIFRVEVHCKPLAARLVNEETTHFYASEGGSPPAFAGSAEGSAPSAPDNAVRTADRRPTVAAPNSGQPAPASPAGEKRPTLAPPRQ